MLYELLKLLGTGRHQHIIKESRLNIRTRLSSVVRVLGVSSVVNTELSNQLCEKIQ